MKYKAVLFDLDGTLLNTIADLQTGVNLALAAYSLPQLPLAEVQKRVGNGIYRLIVECVPDGTPPETVEAVFAAFRREYPAHYMDSTEPYDGILALLQKLKAQGIRIAVVSNKADPMTKGLCAALLPGLADAVYGESSAMPKKPAPDMVFAAMAALGVTAEETLYVGDSEVDCQTAQNAQLPMAAVLWGFRSERELRAAGAECFISHPSELLQKIQDSEFLR